MTAKKKAAAYIYRGVGAGLSADDILKAIIEAVREDLIDRPLEPRKEADVRQTAD